MTANLITVLQQLGIDTEGALHRFSGNINLYKRFLLKFSDDDTFEKVKNALAIEDWDAMLSAAHTLKGVAGNLGLSAIYQASSEIVTSLRAGDQASARTAFLQMETDYQSLISVLESVGREGLI